MFYSLQGILKKDIDLSIPDMASFAGLTTLSPIPQQDSLDIAGRLIDKFQQEDRNHPDVSELLRIPKHSKAKF